MLVLEAMAKPDDDAFAFDASVLDVLALVVEFCCCCCCCCCCRGCVAMIADVRYCGLEVKEDRTVVKGAEGYLWMLLLLAAALLLVSVVVIAVAIMGGYGAAGGTIVATFLF